MCIKWMLSLCWFHLMDLCCSLFSLRMSSGTCISVSAGNYPSLQFVFNGKISLDGSGCVFLQMETRVCHSRVSMVASVKMRSGRTRVSVNKGLGATTVRLVKSLMMFSNLTTDHQTISAVERGVCVFLQLFLSSVRVKMGAVIISAEWRRKTSSVRVPKATSWPMMGSHVTLMVNDVLM